MVIVQESTTKYLFRIEDRTSGTTSVLYTGVYTTSVTNIDKVWWDISYDDKDTGYALINVAGQNEIALNDADGSIVITPDMDSISNEELEHYLATEDPLSKCAGINISSTPGLHLEEGKMCTARGMTVEFLIDMLSQI